MKAKVFPSKNKSDITIPPSKSMSHRAIICASLASGTSTIQDVLYSDDVKTTIEGMRQLGAKIDCFDDYVVITGIQSFKQSSSMHIDCMESGSTLRFFIPIFSLTNSRVTFTGKNRLLKRPQQIYESLFHDQDLYYNQSEESIVIEGKLKPKEYCLKGNVSSQFISGLLFALPLLDEDSVISILPPFESKSYVDLTIEMLSRFGIQIESKENQYYIKGNQTYKACDYTIEKDYSQMAFFGVLGAINSPITCHKMRLDSKQGDKQILSILKDVGIKLVESQDCIEIQPSPIGEANIDLSNCPDLGPILTVLGAYSSKEFHINQAARLRYKESDRIEAMQTELRKLNVMIDSTEDSITIQGKKPLTQEVTVSGCKDHRIVMSLAIFATKAEYPITITQAEYIEKSYPTFFDDLKQLGIKVELYEE